MNISSGKSSKIEVQRQRLFKYFVFGLPASRQLDLCAFVSVLLVGQLEVQYKKASEKEKNLITCRKEVIDATSHL